MTGVTGDIAWKVGDEMVLTEQGAKKRGVVAIARPLTLVADFFDELDDGSRRRAFLRTDPALLRVSTSATGTEQKETPMLNTDPASPDSRPCKHCGEAIEVPPGSKPNGVVQKHYWKCPKRPPRKPYGSKPKVPAATEPPGNPLEPEPSASITIASLEKALEELMEVCKQHGYYQAVIVLEGLMAGLRLRG